MTIDHRPRYHVIAGQLLDVTIELPDGSGVKTRGKVDTAPDGTYGGNVLSLVIKAEGFWPLLPPEPDPTALHLVHTHVPTSPAKGVELPP